MPGKRRVYGAPFKAKVALAAALLDRPWHVVIELQPEAHCCPARFSFSRSTEGCCPPAMRSTSASCWAITASRASR